MFLATGICVVASVQFENVLNWTGPNLSSSQLIVYAQPPQGGPTAARAQQHPARRPEQARHQSRRQLARADRGATGIPGATLHQVGTQAHKDFTGTLYVATPQLLATYGIMTGQIAPGTDVLTMRPGLASLSHMEMTWGNYGVQQGPGGLVHRDRVLPSCTPSNDCLANPGCRRSAACPVAPPHRTR